MPWIENPQVALAGGRIQLASRTYIEPTQAEREAARVANLIDETTVRRELHLTDDADFAYAKLTPGFPPVIAQRSRSGRLESLLNPGDHVRVENLFERDRLHEWRRQLTAFVAKLPR